MSEESNRKIDLVSLSIEETNKLRISLGLKPLEVDTKSKAEENYEKFQEEQDQKRKRQELKDRIQKEKKPKLLSGKSLGEGDDVSTEEWAAKMKDRAKKQQLKIARKKLNELEEQQEYDAQELQGLKVGHDIESLDHETILVLKDTSVLEDGEGDELINVNILDKEKTERNLKFKKGKPKYNPYEEFERQQMGLDKRILAQYDDDEQPTGFLLSTGGVVDLKEKEQQEIQSTLKKGAVSLEYDKSKENQDYYTKDEMLSFRKPKKKKKKSSRKKDDEEQVDEDGDASMEVVHEKFVNSNKKSIDTMNFVDDDDLQQALSKVRKATNKKLLGDPTEIALRILEEEPEEGVQYTGMVISDLTEFVANINPEQEDETNEFEDVEMEADTQKDLPKRQDQTDEQQDVEMKSEGEEEEQAPAILEEEPLVADGLAATLRLLQRKGDLDTVTDEQRKRDQLLKERAKWVAEQKVKDAQRQKELEEEKERLKAQGKKLDKYEMERRNRELERERVRAAQEKFKDYKPTIELVYKDEVGRELDSKQAFKEMSHKFHGKKAGKNKLEKKLTKMGEELKIKQMLASDTPFGTTQALVEKTKDLGHAHITLSVGNRPYGLTNDSVVPELVQAAPSVNQSSNSSTPAVAEKKLQPIVKKPEVIKPVAVHKPLAVVEVPLEEAETINIQNRPKIAMKLTKKKFK